MRKFSQRIMEDYSGEIVGETGDGRTAGIAFIRKSVSNIASAIDHDVLQSNLRKGVIMWDWPN
ncbi:MAG: hypothetical protein HDR09_09600 [Lachnospiraceae bacterium]|nr:hypothetical protein [Lachnospiraceae bacterium]